LAWRILLYERFGAAVAACGEQFERAATVRLGEVARAAERDWSLSHRRLDEIPPRWDGPQPMMALCYT
jgi:hypothetical protein